MLWFIIFLLIIVYHGAHFVFIYKHVYLGRYNEADKSNEKYIHYISLKIVMDVFGSGAIEG
jgi:hypothetical protein